MKIEEFEAILEGSAESPRVDFKTSCLWDVKKFAKDILAISNLQDGGFLIVGIEDKTCKRIGIKAEHKASYSIDIMKDQMSPYADPHVNFIVEVQKDRNGTEHIVIKIFEFTDIPVICKKESEDTKAGTIYYRNNNRKVESAAVSNTHDMRNLIELATIKMMQRKISLGFTVSDSTKEKFDEELKGL